MPRVLIIEDDDLLSRMYQKVFLDNKYDVDTASNGQEGLDHARVHFPDVILLDIMMPGINGMETLKQLKADPSLAKIPVVVLTNLAGNNDIATALQIGAAKYLVKSETRPKQVEEAIRALVSQPK